MRLTTVTIAFIFFGTVFATPIYPLRNSVELSKRMDPEPSTNTGGDATRGRGTTRKTSTRQKGKQASTSAGKRKATNTDGGESESEGDGDKPGSRSKSKSTSRKRAKCDPDLVTKKEFLEALKHIDKGKHAGKGSQSLAVYHITVKVKDCDAVVKIINREHFDDDANAKTSKEVAGLHQVRQLLGWGHRQTPKLDYIMMRNMGIPLDKTGLTDEAYITRKKTEALKRYEDETHLKHGDPAGNGNYLWYLNEDVPETDLENRWTVNVVDWADATQIGPDINEFKTAPKAHDIPNSKDIYGPTESPASSKKGTSSPSEGSDGEGKPKVQHTGSTGERPSSKRIAAKKSTSSLKQQGEASKS
ncbi:hypothetical protein F5887DRAFT_973409 [Amanita rubescens]|nr:hypothetical protein F5887DRAFT_973409 [Amanita rubescens]